MATSVGRTRLRWQRLFFCLLLVSGVSACSGPSGSGVLSSIGRARDTQETGTQSFQVLHTFENGRDGADPSGSLLLVNDTAYGTTWNGGIGKYAVYNPDGTIFKISIGGGHYRVLYRFAAHVPFGQRAYPDGGLVSDSDGNFYGTTNEGGPYAKGTVYKLSPRGRVITLHTFEGGPADGEYPRSKLLRDAKGNLYGTTEAGGSTGCYGAGCGTVFKIDKSGYESVLYAFAGDPADGCVPYGGVVRDRQGNLYGTTTECGSAPCTMYYVCGIVYKIDPHGRETVLYRFTIDGAGGAGPDDTLLLDSNGALYGTTDAGGKADDGVVFKVDEHGNETVLYNFTAGSDGAAPFGGLVQDAAGNFYGTTEDGGGYACNNGNDCGTVFKLDASGNERVLYRFTGKQDGADPVATLSIDSSENLYGTTEYGGDDTCNYDLGCGVVFKLKP